MNNDRRVGSLATFLQAFAPSALALKVREVLDGGDGAPLLGLLERAVKQERDSLT
jgi:hypothetical protein